MAARHWKLRACEVRRLLEELNKIAFASRTHAVTRTGQQAMAVGLVRDWKSLTAQVGRNTGGCLQFLDALKGVMHRAHPAFSYTTVQINKNFPGKLHVDRNNLGPSMMIVVGENLSGGELWYNGGRVPTAERLVEFDGNKPHMTLPYRGRRFSIVMFTSGDARRCDAACYRKLREVHIPAYKTREPVKGVYSQTPKQRLLEAAEMIRAQIRSRKLPRSVLKRIDGKLRA